MFVRTLLIHLVYTSCVRVVYWFRAYARRRTAVSETTGSFSVATAAVSRASHVRGPAPSTTRAGNLLALLELGHAGTHMSEPGARSTSLRAIASIFFSVRMM